MSLVFTFIFNKLSNITWCLSNVIWCHLLLFHFFTTELLFPFTQNKTTNRIPSQTLVVHIKHILWLCHLMAVYVKATEMFVGVCVCGRKVNFWNLVFVHKDVFCQYVLENIMQNKGMSPTMMYVIISFSFQS